MRLKSLEIKGFKSFGNATTLYFDENVTGVVGPNGSGKSNVVDAFRWVLGEQKSKELRLEQMGDVLFNGADKKQQANMAEVSITFDNTKNVLPTEYNTVKITRALYRSGDSEYRINDVACRLKDIHTLLMDTGIGSNSYSIIELGMVDDILSDKENARRRMFEQAAGISKFKKRKKETLQKLKLTNADLERIEDLLFEIQTNLKDLEKQAKRTKRYFEIKEKYKDASILLYKLKWDSLEEGVISLNDQVEVHKVTYSESTAKLAEKEAILEEEKRKNLQEERNLSVFQKTLNDLLDGIHRAENEKNLLSQKIKFAENNILKAKQDIANATPILQESIDKRRKIEIESTKEEKSYEGEKDALENLQKEVDRINQKFQANKQFQEDKFKQLQSLQSNIFEVDKSVAVLQNKLDTFGKDRKQNEDQVEAITEGLASKKDSLSVLLHKISLLTQEVETLCDKEENRIVTIQETEFKIDAKKDTLSKLTRKLDALSNERNLLQSMIENMEGFSESVKFLHTKWKGDKILLSDVINTEEKYRAAVEQVLHPYLNYFIVDDLAQAREAIHILQSAQKGKAQFFLLDEIDDSEALSETALISLASVIETDPKYSALITMICGQVYLATETQIFDQSFTNLALIEEKGGIWRNGQEISGGSVGLFEGKKIGRKKRIEQLDNSIGQEKSNIDKEKKILIKLANELQQVKSSNYDVEIRIKERLKSDAEKEAALIKSYLENSDSTIKALLEKQKLINTENEEVISKIESAKNSKMSLESEILSFQKDVSQHDSNLEQLNQELSSARDGYNKQNIKLIQLENLLAGYKKEVSFQEQREVEIKQTLSEAKKTLDRQEHELETSILKLAELSEALSEKYKLKTQEQDHLTKSEQDYFKARALANEVEEEIRKISKNINDKQFLINQLKDKLNDFKFKKTSIKERLHIEFELKISDLLEVVIDADVAEAELEINVEKYKRRLDNYGEINPMALEAYDEMEKRFVHITAQRDDINEAKTSLIKTISEIEDTATQLFLDSFNEVRKHFVMVFRSLFTQDDDCDLILEDPDDPLNSKIEIIAKPKGKRPKSLSQLSGGEKTLTATALLFSLYLLKPAPFCIFDEVDAPLDDTNIQKFANIIRAFSDKSQFIIVTHNKATMAEVDVLYGVFMQKKGISSVSAVDFRNYEDKGTVATTTLETF